MTTMAEYARRPQRTAEADGLNDVIGGVILLAITFMQYAGVRAQATIHGHNFGETRAYQEGQQYFTIALIAMYGVVLLCTRYAAFLRQRFVYPRLGYVALRVAPAQRRKIILGATALLLSLLIVAARKALPVWPSEMTVLLLGLIFSIGYLWHFATMGFARHLVIAGISFLTALLLFLPHLEWQLSCGLFTVTLSVSLIIAGVIPFVQLLRTPLATEQETE